eukprot:s425_g24.t1
MNRKEWSWVVFSLPGSFVPSHVTLSVLRPSTYGSASGTSRTLTTPPPSLPRPTSLPSCHSTSGSVPLGSRGEWNTVKGAEWTVRDEGGVGKVMEWRGVSHSGPFRLGRDTPPTVHLLTLFSRRAANGRCRRHGPDEKRSAALPLPVTHHHTPVTRFGLAPPLYSCRHLLGSFLTSSLTPLVSRNEGNEEVTTRDRREAWSVEKRNENE